MKPTYLHIVLIVSLPGLSAGWPSRAAAQEDSERAVAEFDEAGFEDNVQDVTTEEFDEAVFKEDVQDKKDADGDDAKTGRGVGGSLPAGDKEPVIPSENDMLLFGENSEDSAMATWESYSDLAPISGVADEITGGIRVEDIVEPPTEYRYAAFGKFDPFIPPLLTEEEMNVNVESVEVPIVSPLQNFNLDELRLVGIWQVSSGDRKAMIMTPTPTNQGIIVKVGDPIAKGKILSIADEYITVRNFTLALDGTRQYEDRQMFMSNAVRYDIGDKFLYDPGSDAPKMVKNSGDHVPSAPEPGAIAAKDLAPLDPVFNAIKPAETSENVQPTINQALDEVPNEPAAPEPPPAGPEEAIPVEVSPAGPEQAAENMSAQPTGTP